MGRHALLAIVLLLLAACGTNLGNLTPQGGGPRLVSDVTLAPTTPAPTRVLSPTPSPVVLRGAAPEVVSPLEIITIDADFVLVTPTLPPTKTPTRTPSRTPTITPSSSPTRTVTATATSPQFPTSIVVRVTAIVSNPLPRICNSTWFFIQPRPAPCPVNDAVAGQGVFQTFENGFMIWVRSQDLIYVLYNDPAQPRWQNFTDVFEDNGTPESDPAFDRLAPSGRFQPRRGFGMLWRNNPTVRERIGWAVEHWEQPYSTQVQIATDGTVFIRDPLTGVFSLSPGGTAWQRFPAAGGFR